MSKLVVETECLEAALKKYGITSVVVSQDELELKAAEHGVTIHLRAPHLPIAVEIQDLTLTIEAIQFKPDGIHVTFRVS